MVHPGSDDPPPNIRPPNPPWKALQPADAGAYLSFYYSDSNSKIPVRDITRFGDSKSDPNIETMTYGLFSTCEEDMRRCVVKKGVEYIFYCTARTRGRARVRVLTGYYHIKWYHKGPELRHHSGKADYWLAADDVRFVNPGFPLADLTGYLGGVRLDKRFRRYLYLDPQTTQKLILLIGEAPDATQDYLKEIKRLEGENILKHGVTYTNWKKKTGFDWDWALKYLGVKA